MPQQQLWVIRHAKTANPVGVGDHERPLARRGPKDAALIGPILASHPRAPKLIVTSTAQRAQETAALLAGFCNCGITSEPSLYLAHAETILEITQLLPAHYDSVALVGHNPGIATFASRLDTNASIATFPTLATASFQLPAWENVRFGSGVLEMSLTPKDLRS